MKLSIVLKASVRINLSVKTHEEGRMAIGIKRLDKVFSETSIESSRCGCGLVSSVLTGETVIGITPAVSLMHAHRYQRNITIFLSGLPSAERISTEI